MFFSVCFLLFASKNFFCSGFTTSNKYTPSSKETQFNETILLVNFLYKSTAHFKDQHFSVKIQNRNLIIFFICLKDKTHLHSIAVSNFENNVRTKIAIEIKF